MWGQERALRQAPVPYFYLFIFCDHELSSLVDLAQPAATVFKVIVNLHPYPLCEDPQSVYLNTTFCAAIPLQTLVEHSQCRVDVPLFLTSTANVSLGRHFGFFLSFTMLRIFPSCLHDFWVIFQMKTVPICPFFYFLNMQQFWDGQSKLNSKNKATAAQFQHFIIFRKCISR